MSKKIKEVNIEAFRAYEKFQKFDFVHKGTGNIADLVVVYAPNGYGKTSFFDAIEWAVTDEIGRFKSTKAIKQEVDSEKGDILKNRNSNKLQGFVQIVSEGSNNFEKKTKRLTGNMKSDYKPGDLEPLAPELQGILNEKNTFCTTNMLAHDKITSFLHSYTAEDKTKALQVFWDTNGYSEILDRIKNLYDEIEKNEKLLSKEIQKEESELKQYNYESDKEKDVLRLINSFNIVNNDLKIESESIINNIDKLLEKTDSVLKTMQDSKSHNEAQLDSIDLIINDYPSYISNKTELDCNKNEKKELEKKKELLNRVDNLLQQKEKLQIERDKFFAVINNWQVFPNTENEIGEKKNLKKEIENAKLEFQKKVIQIKDNTNKCKDNISAHSQQKDKEIERIRSIEIDFRKYSENRITLGKYSKLLTKVALVLNNRVKRRGTSSYEISNIEAFVENKCSVEQIKDFVPENIVDANERITSLKKEKSDQDNQIQLLEERYRTTILLQDKTSQLLIQGKELVDITKTCECPLCHTKHEDYLALISRITADYKGNVEMDIIETNLEASKKINSIIVENLAVESENLKKSLEEVLGVKKGIFNKQNEKIRRLQLQINDWNNLSNNLQNENVSIQNRYNSITIDIQNSEAINLFKSEIDKSIVDLSQIIADEEVKIASDLVLVNNLEATMQKDELKIVEIEGRISELKNNELYSSILLFLENKTLRNDNDDSQIILSKIENAKDNLVGEILLSDSEIKNTQNKVLGTREEIDGKYSSILDKIQEESVVTDGYRLRLKKVFENEDIENADNFEVLEKKKSDIIKKNNRVSENISLLQSLLSNVNGLKEQKIWINRKKESESKKAKLNNIQTKRAALEKSKVVVETYIVNQTNAYFNSNTINQIYNKIDPHPTMNHIKFLTERSDKGLKTNIYTYDESEEDKMSPVLYLSSAQVNILSLCIFLAKVLTEQDTTLNTIFMDDPIQHLDGINLLAFIDLLRTITTTMGRQIVISTHNEHFYNLIKVKMDDRYYLSKFIELNSVGEVRKIINY